MRRYSRGILNCSGGDGDGDGISPNPNRRTPDHPPYSEMVSVALRSLAEENGSTETSISAYIQSTFIDLPWGHDRLLPYYLKKLILDGELTSPSPDRYQFPLHPPPSPSLPVRRRGRPRLYPPNSNPNPNPNPNPSPRPPRRGTSQPLRRRGRPRKILVEETPSLRRGRGDAVGRRLALRLSRSRGYKRRQGSDGEGLNCQTGDLTLVDDVGKGGSECAGVEGAERIEVGDAPNGEGQPFVAAEQGGVGEGMLEDSEHVEVGDTQKGEGLVFVAPEQCGVGKGQFFGEEPPLLIVEHGEGHLLQGEGMSFAASEKTEFSQDQSLLASKKTEFSQDQSLLGQKLPLLTPELGKVLPFLAPGVFEHEQGQSTQEEASPFVALEETEPVQDQLLQREREPFFTLEPGKVPPILVPEFFEHDQRQSPQGEAPPFMPPEQIELGQKQLSEAPPLLSSEQPEHEVFELDQGQSMQGEAPPFVVLEETEPSQDQSLPRERLPFFTPEPGNVPPFLAHDLFEHDQGQSPQGEALPFMPPVQTELIHKQSTEGPPLLSPEQPEHENGLRLATPEESEDDHEQRLLGVGTIDPEEELVLTPRPDEEEVENTAVSSKKRKSHGRRSRSLKLWFES